MTTIRNLRLMAAHMGVSVQELIRRRVARRTDDIACADDTGTVHIKTRVFCNPDLSGWAPIARTIYR